MDETTERVIKKARQLLMVCDMLAAVMNDKESRILARLDLRRALEAYDQEHPPDNAD